MPVWNGCRSGDRYLRMAIESIRSQTLRDWEMVVVDDGSTDATPAILSEFAAKDQRIRVLRNDSNERIVRALNRGLKECRAPLVARMDADDYCTVTRLELQKRFMDERPSTALCGTGMYVVDEEDRLVMEVRRPCAVGPIREFLKSGCPFPHGSVMFRRDVVLGLGGYSTEPEFEYAEDYELWVRMAIAGHDLENIPDRSLYFHRNHGNKSSSVHARQQEVASRRVVAVANREIR